jgi:hypothetical protein
MRIIIAVLCLLAPVGALRAEEPEALGLGITAGRFPGLVAELLYGARSLSAGVASGRELTLYGDALVYPFTPASPAAGRPLAHFGLGLQVSPEEYGLRAVAGLGYRVPRTGVGLFLDAVHVLRLSPGNSGGLSLSAGARYYFGLPQGLSTSTEAAGHKYQYPRPAAKG